MLASDHCHLEVTAALNELIAQVQNFNWHSHLSH